MKPKALIFAFAVLALIVPETVQAQYSRYNFDTDIQAVRNNLMPEFHHNYDDYIQYSTAVVMVGLKACGYKGRSGWGRMLTSDAFSIVTMTGVVHGLKHSVRRMRPDGSRTNSFPSGHSASAFMTAAMLNKEYGWRSPWWGIGSYSLATFVTMSRIMNNKHWMSDTVAGALIGVGSVELGYFLADLIFKDKYLNPDWEKPEINYCPKDNRYYSLGLEYSRRFILADRSLKSDSTMPFRGSDVALHAEVPIMNGFGFSARLKAGSLRFKDDSSFNMYAGQAGAFWSIGFAKVLEFETELMAGYAWHRKGNGIDLSAVASLNLITGTNFKLRALAEWETFSYATMPGVKGNRCLNSILLGYSAAFFF